MNLKKFFGRGEEKEDLLDELTLSTMKKGFLLDYDLKTWEVIGCNNYDYEGFPTQEWELRAGEEVRFLERGEEDGRVEWTLTRRIGLAELEEDVVAAFAAADEPPEEVHFGQRLYRGTESSAGLWFQGGEEPGRDFVVWTYESEEGKRLLFVTRWGERDFSVYEGEYVEEYQFTDILPGVQR